MATAKTLEATCGSIRATVTSGGNVELTTVHRGALLGPDDNVVIQHDDVGDVIAALQCVRENGGRSDQGVLDDLQKAIGRIEAQQHSGWTAYDELVKTLTSEMGGLGVPGTSVKNYGLVPAIKAALNHIRTAPHAIIAERDAARADCEQLRKMVFANDRVLFDGRPARTRSCSACHVGAVSDPYGLAPLDIAVKDAPVTAVMAIAVGSVDIFETTREAREIADRAGRAVAFDCQGVTVVVSPGDDPDAVARAWWWTRHGETPEQSAARR